MPENTKTLNTSADFMWKIYDPAYNELWGEESALH
jgi:hypothetical protein